MFPLSDQEDFVRGEKKNKTKQKRTGISSFLNIATPLRMSARATYCSVDMITAPDIKKKKSGRIRPEREREPDCRRRRVAQG
jgi:hypothetical protein